MMTREEIRGHWNELRGRIEERWTQLGPNDLDDVEGNTDQLIGIIQQKTGQARQKIEEELDSMLENLPESQSGAGEKMGQYARQAQEQFRHASESAREQYNRMGQSVSQGYRQAEDTVRQRPTQSVAAAFGTGLIAGVVVGLIMMRR